MLPPRSRKWCRAVQCRGSTVASLGAPTSIQLGLAWHVTETRGAAINLGPQTLESMSSDLLRKMHAYWRAANYLPVGQQSSIALCGVRSRLPGRRADRPTHLCIVSSESFLIPVACIASATSGFASAFLSRRSKYLTSRAACGSTPIPAGALRPFSGRSF